MKEIINRLKYSLISSDQLDLFSYFFLHMPAERAEFEKYIKKNPDDDYQLTEKGTDFIINLVKSKGEGFILNNPEYIATMRKETEFSKMETRILNTIYSMAKSKSEFYLEDIVLTVHEDNKDLIIDSIERLLDKQIIISNN